MRGPVARAVAVIRIDAIWMSTEPLDMRAGFDKALARVVQVFGAAHPHHAYLFANARSNMLHAVAQSIRSCSKRTFCPQRCCLRSR